ncbi:MAG TPA: protein-L-isoaspartate(D-aspartate) O-methyltransferase [Candidatus Deferrimicrobium sp.]|nr:protein-L-isoaspartate(D-aspartate) O-methyltransferase [Candidatus Deferrimicrobium sp.]
MEQEMDLEKKKEQLLDYYKFSKTAKSKEVIEAFRRVPREDFIHPSQRSQAYEDHPLPIGHGQTISAPHMAFIMCELLELKEGDKVLEIGGGSGYHAAMCAAIVAPPKSQNPGHVYTIERVPALVEFARENLKKAGFSDLVTVIEGDGTLGYPEKAPYDAIQVTAAGPKVPEPLVEQLKVGGRLVIPVGGRHMYQELVLVKKVKPDKVIQKNVGGVAFVPLIGKHGWDYQDNIE